MDSLSFYSIKRRVGTEVIDDFDDAIDPDRLATVDETETFETAQGVDPAWSAKLYVWQGEPRPPAWLEFLEDGFGTDLDVPDMAQSRAVLIVRVTYFVPRMYAIPFGAGRFQLRKDVIDRGYGLRVALNSLYEGDEDADELTTAPRIRQVESKTVAANTMRTVRQTNRTTDFEQFEIDQDRDQLAGVTGQPADETLARRVRGTDAIRLARRTAFDELGHICRNIARYHGRDDYKRRFEFVDRFEGIADPSQIETLTELLQANLQADTQTWTLATPGIQNFDVVASYRVTGPDLEPTEFVDPTVQDIVDISPGFAEVVAHLRDIRIESIDANGDRIDRWKLFECLDGQITDGDDDTFLLEGGIFYSIESGFLQQLDADIDQIQESTVVLPPSVRVMVNGQLKEIDEGTYNELAAEPANHFLLDKKTVVIPGRTSPIEVCDVLTDDRKLVHVKRKFSSSSLSHLFGQGYVSSELFVDSEPYRQKVREKIGNNHPQFQALFGDAPPVTSGWEIVYAVVGPWSGDTPAERLPFFSKINLRNHARGLRRLGFDVTIARVPVVDP